MKIYIYAYTNSNILYRINIFQLTADILLEFIEYIYTSIFIYILADVRDISKYIFARRFCYNSYEKRNFGKKPIYENISAISLKEPF